MLTREERFEAIAISEASRLIAMADDVLATNEVKVLRPPASGAVMMRAIETAEGSVFNLGEVAVTEAEVELAGERGYCMVLGYAPEKALAGAVLDAAAEARIAVAAIEQLLTESLVAKAADEGREWERLAPTRVQFDEIPRMTTQAVIFTPQARQAQATFREALECLARPGRIGSIGDSAFPERTARHAYGLLLALADQEVTIAVTGADETLARFASLGTGSRLEEPDRAAYLLCLEDPGDLLPELKRGTLEVPEAGATVIVAVESLVVGATWRLVGPGVAGTASLTVTGLSGETVAARNATCDEYPLGIDLFLVDPEGRLVGIPRTTFISPEGN